MSDVEKIIAEALTADVHNEDGWLSSAQSADLHVGSGDEVFFCGEGSIDVSHVAGLVLRALHAAGYEVEKPVWEYRAESEAPGNLHIVYTPTESYEDAYGSMLGDINGKRVVRRRKAGAWQTVEEGYNGKVADQ